MPGRARGWTVYTNAENVRAALAELVRSLDGDLEALLDHGRAARARMNEEPRP